MPLCERKCLSTTLPPVDEVPGHYQAGIFPVCMRYTEEETLEAIGVVHSGILELTLSIGGYTVELYGRTVYECALCGMATRPSHSAADQLHADVFHFAASLQTHDIEDISEAAGSDGRAVYRELADRGFALRSGN